MPPTTSSKTAESSSSSVEFEPPLASIRRILKMNLPDTTNVGKDASAVFARACGIFVIYLTTCANDYARENKRQTITANDILAAIKELEFDDFTPQLEAFLAHYRAEEQSKKDAKAKNKAAMQQSAQQAEESLDTKEAASDEPAKEDDKYEDAEDEITQDNEMTDSAAPTEKEDDADNQQEKSSDEGDATMTNE
uniref:Transcription factor CBF/NF-Y/archaeal histone domain-containing protein n=1 Tax=Leptocylindrus danicus TaxID=163516 RepID=A0A7S2P9S8_9STRA